MRRIWKPELCHGIGKAKFEGWYYKLVDQSREAAIAIIPGFSSANPNHAFIQIFNGITGDYQYNTFSMNDFRYTKNNFEVFISDNYFSIDVIKLNLNTQDHVVKGELTFKNQVPWPIKFLSPGAMGPFAFLPRMECSHAVLSFDHEIYGNLNVNGEDYSFDYGRGYIEKDWGSSFPSGYVWMQSNHFSEQKVSFMASIARIPYLGKSFTGFLAGFLYREKLYLFSTYNRTKLKDLTIDGNRVSFKLVKKEQVVEVDAIQTKSSHLKGPIQGKMIGKVFESLTSTINLRFIDLQNKTEFNGVGNLSGMEIMAKEEDLH